MVFNLIAMYRVGLQKFKISFLIEKMLSVNLEAGPLVPFNVV